MDQSSAHPPQILIIDDDVELCELLSKYLEADGFVVESVHDGLAGVEAASNTQFDVIVLDVMLPRLNGIEVLKHVYAVLKTPVLMLTARGDDIDRIIGLEMGADDYLGKPCNPRELAARLRAILRRAARIDHGIDDGITVKRFNVGDLILDGNALAAYRNGHGLPLTGTEYRVLEVLARSSGQVVSKDALTEKALARKFSPHDRSIDTHIGRLRRKLGPFANGLQRIKTVRGQGYIYVLNEPMTSEDY